MRLDRNPFHCLSSATVTPKRLEMASSESPDRMRYCPLGADADCAIREDEELWEAAALPGTFKLSPTLMRVVVKPFQRCSIATVVPKRPAMRLRLSPERTRYCPSGALAAAAVESPTPSGLTIK
jgi:hypothetical protein